MSGYSILKVFTGVFLIICLMAESVFAGAWPQEKGCLYNQATINYYKANEKFSNGGSRVDFDDNGKFLDRNISYYVEYGLTDDFTVTGSWPYKWLEYENDLVINKSDGFSDLELGLKYRLFSRESGVCSVQGLVKIPEAYGKNDSVPLGNGQYDYEIRLLYGQSLFPNFPGYFNTEAGYRFRAGEPADEFKYLIEFSVDITKKIYGRVKLDGTLGMNNAGDASHLNDNPTTTLDYDLGKLEMTLGWKILKMWGVELGCRPEIYGKNTAAGVNYSLSVIYRTY